MPPGMAGSSDTYFVRWLFFSGVFVRTGLDVGVVDLLLDSVPSGGLPLCARFVRYASRWLLVSLELRFSATLVLGSTFIPPRSSADPSASRLVFWGNALLFPVLVSVCGAFLRGFTSFLGFSSSGRVGTDKFRCVLLACVV